VRGVEASTAAPGSPAPLSPEKRRLVELRLKGLGRRDDGVPRRADGSSGPLALAQEAFWISDGFAPGSAAYAVSRAWRISGGALDGGLLAAALEDLAARHEVLRTVFAVAEGAPQQVVLERPAVAFHELDLRGEDDPERAALSWIDEAAWDYDLRRRPAWRAGLLRIHEHEHVLAFCAHHIVCDAWSLELVLTELDELYRARRDDREPALPPLPAQYLDFALWQRGRFDEAAVAAELEHWRGRLAGVPAAIGPPLDGPRRHERIREAAGVDFRLPRALVDGLRELGVATSSGLFATCLAGLATLLARHGGERDVVVGVPVGGRTAVELEPLVGCFVGTVPLRLDLSGRPSFRELVGRVRATSLDALAHQELPASWLAHELRGDRARSAPLFQVLFSHHERDRAPARFAGLPAEPFALLAPRRIEFDLMPMQTEEPDGITCHWGFAADVLDRATVAELGASYARLLEAAARDPDRSVERLPLLAADERARVLRAARGPAEPRPPETVLPAIDALARRGEAVALAAADGETVTYARLARWSTTIAARLAAAGIGSERLVAVAWDGMPSPAALAGVLGAVRAGAAAVPLDVAHADAWAGRAFAAVVCEPRLAARLPVAVPLIVPASEELSQTAPAPAVSPASLACVVDAGLLVEQRTLAALAHAAELRLGLAPGDRVPAPARLDSAAALALVLAALAEGASLVLDGGDEPAALAAPAPGVSAYVVDALLEPVAPGVPGELVLGGLAVARGYLGRRAETAAAFVPDPFGGEPGARLHRTGLRAKWTRSGELRLLSSAAVEPRAEAQPAKDAVAPRNDYERDVAAVWAELLGVDEIGVGDDFFELGGDSLLLMRVLARIEQRFGVELPLSALFPEPTVERLGSALERELAGTPRSGPSTPAGEDVERLVAGLTEAEADLLLRQLAG